MEDYGSRRTASADAPAIVHSDLPTPGWERGVLEKLLQDLVVERRRARRWGIFFKLAGLVIVACVLALVIGKSDLGMSEATGTKHTALIDLNGVIDVGSETNADNIITALQSAFKDPNTAGIVLRINSPGGSPVQAGMINDEIVRLRAKHPSIPLYAVVEEMCASGGYYVAVAADRIYVDKASLVGSIGVLMDGFGFVGAMDKLGVERRLLTAGKNKGFLDSFSPIPDEQKQFAQKMLADIHQQFIDVVKKGRGARLKESADLFSGLVWTGAQSIEMGLTDGLGTLNSIARDVIKVEDVVDFSPKENIAERLAKRIGAQAGESMLRGLRATGGTPALR
jgi:protease-4